MNGIGSAISSKNCDQLPILVDNGMKDKYSMTMRTMTKKDWLASFMLMIPIITTLAYASYKLALEIWCIAYGLIY